MPILITAYFRKSTRQRCEEYNNALHGQVNFGSALIKSVIWTIIYVSIFYFYYKQFRMLCSN